MSPIVAADTVIEVVRTAREREITFMAASFAHYALVSLVPLVVIALAVATTAGEGQLVPRLVAWTEPYLTPSGREVLAQALRNSEVRTGAGVLSLLVLLWSGLKVFRGLSIAFAEVYDAGLSIPLFVQLRNGLLVLGLVALAVALMVATGVALAVLDPPIENPAIAGSAGLFVALAVVLLPVYYVLPPVPVTVREVVPGAVVAAAGWLLLEVVFLYYVQNAARYRAYGLLGAVLLFVTWLYFGGLVILLGAVVNAVLAGEAAAERRGESR
ncbi:YihY/virulence factor BrkB family protein [Halegenticoccus soli]|uniref:YihY/virulence factor BrkB family protein n=1 Tax=Halegenticoccus soli TaxID=1985678 RepID=UPI001E42801F|nr:YihY/virulence factor BrkB family protein [Halegenticoccus soli]